MFEISLLGEFIIRLSRYDEANALVEAALQKYDQFLKPPDAEIYYGIRTETEQLPKQ